jgi:hypothetical protein
MHQGAAAMRRILPLFIFTLGTAMLLVPDAADARHGHRRCHRKCCQNYEIFTESPNYEIYTDRTTVTDCPMYRMMQMGGLYNYYTLEYAAGCNGSSTPISYETEDGSIAVPCICGANTTCCFSSIRGPRPFLTMLTPKGGHKIDKNAKDHFVRKGWKAADSMTMHGQLDRGTTQVLEFVAPIDDGSGNVWWAKLGQFQYVNGSLTMPEFVGYEVDVDPTGSADVNKAYVTATAVSGFTYIVTVTVAIPATPTDPNPVYNGVYQVTRAH